MDYFLNLSNRKNLVSWLVPAESGCDKKKVFHLSLWPVSTKFGSDLIGKVKPIRKRKKLKITFQL